MFILIFSISDDSKIDSRILFKDRLITLSENTGKVSNGDNILSNGFNIVIALVPLMVLSLYHCLSLIA